MYRRKLILAFVLLGALVLTQALLAFWLIQKAQYHEQRSRLAHEMLTRYTAVAADKQRLKVWFAQLLLTGQTEVQTRDELLRNISNHIEQLRGLKRQINALEQGSGRSDESTLDVLQSNFANFSERVSKYNDTRNRWLTPGLEPQLATEKLWLEVLGIFDKTGSQDVRVVLTAAITRHAQTSEQAQRAADLAIKRSNSILLAMLALVVLCLVGMAWYFVRQLSRPMTDLLSGTEQLRQAAGAGAQPVNIPMRSRDEFGQLATHFNAMALEIHQARQADLQKAQVLESAVSARTQELTRANQELQHIDASRRQLFADISHELRTPVTAILGEAEIALRGQDKPVAEYKYALANISSSTKQLAKRSADFLEVAKQEISSPAPQQEVFNLLELLHECLEQARAMAQTVGQPILSAPSLGSTGTQQAVWVRSDPELLQQLLMIVYDNALRYTPADGQINTRIEPAVPATANTPADVFLHIQDTGIGIAADEQTQVFERSFRGQRARNMRADGMGLGLAIAKNLAAKLGIELRLSSAGVGLGTCVSLRIAVAAED